MFCTIRIWNFWDCGLNSVIFRADEKISDKKTWIYIYRCASIECYLEFYCTRTFIAPSLFYNDPLEFENYFPFCLSAEAKCPFQFTFRRCVFTAHKDIRRIFPRFSLLVYDFAQRNLRKCSKVHSKKVYNVFCLIFSLKSCLHFDRIIFFFYILY